MTMPTLASAEDVAIAWLLSLTVVTSAASTRVGTKLSGNTWPQVRVTRTGGTVNEDPWYDNPRVQVEFWGSSPDETGITDDDIDQLARDVTAKVPYMRGSIGGGIITSSYTSLGPFPSPDPATNRYRQLIEITFEVE